MTHTDQNTARIVPQNSVLLLLRGHRKKVCRKEDFLAPTPSVRQPLFETSDSNFCAELFPEWILVRKFPGRIITRGCHNDAFGKRSIYLGDTRQFRHVRRLLGFEEQNALFLWIECTIRIFLVEFISVPIHAAPVFAPARLQEKTLGELFMYWFRARAQRVDF